MKGKTITKEEFLESRQSYTVGELKEIRPDIYEKILKSKMDDRHSHLNNLMD